MAEIVGIFIGKTASEVAFPSGAVAFGIISTLNHKAKNGAVERGVRVFSFTRKGKKIFGEGGGFGRKKTNFYGSGCGLKFNNFFSGGGESGLKFFGRGKVGGLWRF